MHLLLAAEDSIPELCAEVRREFGGAAPVQDTPVLFQVNGPSVSGDRLPYVVYARQLLPDAERVHADSITAWAAALFEATVNVLPEGQPWRLHIQPQYYAKTVQRMGARAWHSAGRFSTTPHNGPKPDHHGRAGGNRCALIADSFCELLQKKRRHLFRYLRKGVEPFCPEDSLIQLLLTSPDAGFLSIAQAPLPFTQRHIISPFPKGEVKLAVDKAAPSRAFTKLVEAEARLGRRIQTGETCVDLGAAPGSWTYVAAQRRARVIAVDRSTLRPDLMESPWVDFRAGDAFRFQPQDTVDWLLCDVIAAPERSGALLVKWLQKRLCRHFIVTIKINEASGMGVLDNLKKVLPKLAGELFLLRLCANKKEICAFGSLALVSAPTPQG